MKSEQNSLVGPPLAPRNFAEFLEDADYLVTFMASEPLHVVARAAKMLSVTARGVDALEIADAADAVSRISSARDAVSLTSAMRKLSTAVAEAKLVHA